MEMQIYEIKMNLEKKVIHRGMWGDGDAVCEDREGGKGHGVRKPQCGTPRQTKMLTANYSKNSKLRRFL